VTATTTVNMLTVVHRKSDGVITSGPPDVCLTPPQNLPVPYVNVAFSKDLVQGSTTVTVDGEPIALKDSEFSTSTGDEPGSGGGVASGVNKGWAKFINYSTDVIVEGRNVCRLSDPMIMNGNGPNTIGPAEVQNNVAALGDLKDILCEAFCWCDGKDGKGGNKGKDFVKKTVIKIDPGMA
jgi:uncharacterized Zn-binding protein involved in type VI secretion